MPKYDKKNVLSFGCTHFPFVKKGYLEFLLGVQKKEKCGTVICLGDLVDNHSISYHEHDPDLWSPAQEMEETDKILKKWFKAFPELKITRGNHDRLVDRKGKTVGLPKRCFKPYREIWNFPDGWEDAFYFIIDGVYYFHGEGYSGRGGHLQAANAHRLSTVMAHLHSFAGIEFTASDRDCIFGMNVGCGIDAKALAFAYGKHFKFKPIVSCGVVYNGEDPRIFRMKL